MVPRPERIDLNPEPAGSSARMLVVEGGELVVLERGQAWVFTEGRWLELSGALAGELSAVLDGGEPGERLAALMRSGLPGADHIVEVCRSPYRELDRKSLAVDSPDILFVELTDRCLLRCQHCYADASGDRDATMAVETARDLIGEAARLGFARLQLTGGEPLLHPRLSELVEHAWSAGLPSVEIYTCGLGLTPGLLDDVRPQTRFALSVYGAEAAVHDRITGVAGSWAGTLAAIDSLVARGIYARVGVVLMEQNADAWPATRRLLVERGVPERRIRATGFSRVGRGEELEGECDRLDRAASSAGRDRGAQESQRDPVVWRGKAAVSANGDVFPCIFARWLVLGNVGQRGLGQILGDPAPLPVSELGVVDRWDYCAERLSCPDCRVMAFWLMGGAR